MDNTRAIRVNTTAACAVVKSLVDQGITPTSIAEEMLATFSSSNRSNREAHKMSLLLYFAPNTQLNKTQEQFLKWTIQYTTAAAV